jgi:sec-independent protein translocase protein TatA
MFGSLGTPEILVIFVIALIFFGPSKLPEFGKSLGEAIRGFKKAVSDAEKTPIENAQSAVITEPGNKPQDELAGNT